MRLLYLDWPHLPYRLEVARASVPLPELVVIGGQPWEPASVLDASPAAVRLGVRRDQPLGTAHRLAPEAHFMPADRELYRRMMERALDALAAFTPGIEADADPDARAFGQVLLGIEGLHRLWGDDERLVGRVTDVVRGLLPTQPRIGIGNTRFGAQVAAVVGRGRLEKIASGDAGVEAAYLAPLPIRLLPADDETRERLRVFGLTSIGELAALAGSAVVARFGAHGAMLHELAQGRDGRPLRPRKPVQHLRAEAELEPPVDTLDPLRFLLHNLCGALCEQLSARGAGATRALMTLELEHGRGPLVLEQQLPEPAAAPDLLERLLFARLTGSPPTAPVTRFVLELRGEQVAAGQQLGLFTPQLARAGRLDWQLVGLALRFGADRVLRARTLDPQQIVPESRTELVPATSAPGAPAASL
ncbi:MAG TPA: DNA polymerase Y family protein [Candidatus Limnocylindrales bacterium]